MNVIKSMKHIVQVNMTVLSSFDNKRYILNDGVTSYAYGHYQIYKGNI